MVKECTKPSVKQIMTAKITALRTLFVHVVLNSVVFPQILYDMLDIFHLSSFFPSITFINFVLSYRKM